MAQLFVSPFAPAFGPLGTVLPGATLTFYATGTTAKITVFADAAQTTPLPNPVLADLSGRFPAIYVPDGSRVVLKSAAGAVVQDIDPVNGSDSALSSYKSALPNAVTRPIDDKLAETVSLFEFINPQYHNATIARTYTGDLSGEMQAAIDACNGYALKVPVGKFPYVTPPQVDKNTRIRIYGEVATYDRAPVEAIRGSELCCIGTTGPAFIVGVADGNPDTTGFTQGFELENITLSTPWSTGTDDGILIQDTSSFRLENIKFRGFRSRTINLTGGTVTGHIVGCDILGTGQAGGVGIYLDDYAFGNFDLTIERNHIYQFDYAQSISGGRYFRSFNNTIENIALGQYRLLGAATLNDASFLLDKSESQKGYVFYQDPASTGLILSLTVHGLTCFGAIQPGYNNPAFGNLRKQLVAEHHVSENYILDTNRNIDVQSSSVFISTNIFDAATTALDPDTFGRDFRSDFVDALRDKGMVGIPGRFTDTDGSTGGTLPVIKSGGKPIGWTALGGINWQLVPGGPDGGLVCTPILAAPSDILSFNVTLAPETTTRCFVVPFSGRGRILLLVSINGGAYAGMFDSGVLPGYYTGYGRFTTPAGATSFTIKIVQQDTAPVIPLELEVYEVGAAEYNDTTDQVRIALRQTMKRGAY